MSDERAGYRKTDANRHDGKSLGASRAEKNRKGEPMPRFIVPDATVLTSPLPLMVGDNDRPLGAPLLRKCAHRVLRRVQFLMPLEEGEFKTTREFCQRHWGVVLLEAAPLEETPLGEHPVCL